MNTTLYKSILRPLLFRCDAEWVHNQAIRQAALFGACPPALGALSRCCKFSDERLATEVCGLRFAIPIGLAAGYDKSGRAIRMMAALGFSHVEIGSVSAFPSQGNPKPRLWRLPADRAICVHYGLLNDGAEVVARRLTGQRWPVPLGINIVKTNYGINATPDSAETIFEDYLRSVTLLKDLGDYLCLNLSCPNTEMGCSFFGLPGTLEELLSRLKELNLRRPVFLKISPVTGDLLAHCIDAAIWLNGPVTQVNAMTETFIKERRHAVSGNIQPVGIDDACAFLCRFANGSLGVFESTRYARGHKALYTFEINGKDASIRWDLHDLHRLEYFDHRDEGKLRGWRSIHVTDHGGAHPYMEKWWVPGLQIGYEHSFVHQLADFLASLETGSVCSPTFRDALETQKICDAILKSAGERRWIEVSR